MCYCLKYGLSLDGPWSWADDGTSTYAGQSPVPPAFTHGFTTTALAVTNTWPTSGLPDGQYYLRLEAYRNGYPLHYSYDTTKFTLKK
jgi:hypothetical protein